jgi:hypothetical protein
LTRPLSTPPRPTGAPPIARPRRAKPRGRPAGNFTQHRRLDRLRTVLEANPRGLSLDELAVMLHVTTRSVRRYLKELGRITEIESIPTLPGAAHEWRIKPSERGRAVALRRTQAYGLMAPRELFQIFKGSALYDELDIGVGMIATLALRPTRGRSGGDIPVDQRLEDRFRFVSFPAKSYAGRGELLDELFRSVAESRETRMRLTPRMDEVFDAHPYALVVNQGELFCIARNLSSGSVETIAFEHIAEALPSEKRRFIVPNDFAIAPYLHGVFGVAAPQTLTPIIVEFDATVAPEIRSRKWHPSQRMATAPDGRVRLSLTVPDLEIAHRWILSFGAHARVIEPTELAGRVRESLEDALARYTT